MRKVTSSWFFLYTLIRYIFLFSNSEAVSYNYRILVSRQRNVDTTEVVVINVKYHCHKATRTLNVTQTTAWLTQLSYSVDSKLYSDFCIARDCFMILMLRRFQFNALSRGNQRPNLPYKKACRGIFG